MPGLKEILGAVSIHHAGGVLFSLSSSARANGALAKTKMLKRTGGPNRNILKILALTPVHAEDGTAQKSGAT